MGNDEVRRDDMFITSHSRDRREALESWRDAARLASDRWHRFLGAEPEMRVFAFASYVAALDSEEAAAAHLANVEHATAA
jgi:hypothetical protein